MHRFLGYNLQSVTNDTVGFAIDFLLLVVLLFIWKPLALLVIYAELLLRVVALCMLTVLQALWDVRPFAVLRQAVMKPYYLALAYFGGMAFLHIVADDAWRQRKLQTRRELMECVVCVASLSLLLRFISGGPSSVDMRKHDKLHKHSVLYRVFRHII